MGKIANALGKYAQERKTARLATLSRADLDVLMSYNRNTGHLLNHETDAGRPAGRSIEALRNRGTIQRLLDYELIFPGGKLTPKGLAECERLKKLNQVRKPAMDAAIKVKEKYIEDLDTDDVVIDLEEEVEPVEPYGMVESPPEKAAPRLKRSSAPKSRPTPPVEVPAVAGDNETAVTIEDKRSTALPGISEKPQGKEAGADRPPAVVPGV